MKAAFVVLLGLLLLPAAAHSQSCTALHSDPCGLPPEFAHATSVEESGIRVTFASTAANFVLGDTIEFQLVFENIGSEYFCMNSSYQPIDVVFVLPSGCSNVADPCADDGAWLYPGSVFFAPGVGVGLNPGECRVFTYAWDTAAVPAVPGDYNVLSGLFEATFDAAVGDFRMPSNGLQLALHVGAPVPTGGLSTSVLKARFR